MGSLFVVLQSKEPTENSLCQLKKLKTESYPENKLPRSVPQYKTDL